MKSYGANRTTQYHTKTRTKNIPDFVTTWGCKVTFTLRPIDLLK